MRTAALGLETGARYGEMMARYLGPVIVQAFADEDVAEIYVNPQDGLARFDTRSRGRIDSGVSVAATRVEMFLNAVATSLGLTLGADHPGLEAERRVPPSHLHPTAPASRFLRRPAGSCSPPASCSSARSIS